MLIVNHFLFYGLQKTSPMIYWKNLKTLFFQIKVPAKRGNEVFQAPLKPRRGQFCSPRISPLVASLTEEQALSLKGKPLANLQGLYSSYLYIK